MRNLFVVVMAAFLLAGLTVNAGAESEQKAGGPPPMLVATAEVVAGSAEPMASFVGTIYFARSANVAAEVGGIVRRVLVNDGDSVRKGDALVVLDDDLMSTEVEGTRAAYEQNQVDVAQAQRDFERIANLYEEESIAETEYEAYQTSLRRFEKQSIVLKARLDKLLLEQQKKTIRAPFDGVVIEKLVEAGEWLAEGGAAALVADNRSFEVLVEIPANLIGFLERGRQVPLSVNGSTLQGEFLAVIPKGDIATRTFSAKFGVKGTPGLVEGMEARVQLPTSEATDGLLVPRDAVIDSFGQQVVFTVVDGLAQMVPVQVIGYSGLQVAVSGTGLEAGQQVVTKGNERIRDGQPVRAGE